MKDDTWRTIIAGMLLGFFIGTNVWASSLPVKQSVRPELKNTQERVTKSSKVKAIEGYCCINGAVSPMQEKRCNLKQGSWYADKNEALQDCGFCCIQGEIIPAQLRQCKIKGGKFSQTKEGAKKECTGFCCRDGKISKMTRDQCSRKQDKFYTNISEAQKQCSGWCCSEFEVSEATEKQCSNKQGIFFADRSKADQYCSNRKGWCCVNGKIERLNRNECKNDHGEFYLNDQQAKRSCQAVIGFCNIDRQTVRLTEKKCRDKDGDWFSHAILAKKQLLKRSEMKQSVRKQLNEQPQVQPVGKNISKSGTIIKLQRPDLVPARIWVDPKTCRLWNEWENNGGEAPEKIFTERFTLNGSFRHGQQSMTSYSFDSRNEYPIPAGAKENHEVYDLYPIIITGPTKVEFIIDGTNVHFETNESNNKMVVDLNCQAQAGYRIPAAGTKGMVSPDKADIRHAGSSAKNKSTINLGDKNRESGLLRGYGAAGYRNGYRLTITPDKKAYLFNETMNVSYSVLKDAGFKPDGDLQIAFYNPDSNHYSGYFAIQHIHQEDAASGSVNMSMDVPPHPELQDSDNWSIRLISYDFSILYAESSTFRLQLMSRLDNDFEIIPIKPEKIPVASLDARNRFVPYQFGFIHPTAGEEFDRSNITFSWRPHGEADKYFLRIMKTGRAAGEHQTIWSKGNINNTSVAFNDNGTAAEELLAGIEYRANLYAQRSEHPGIPDNDPGDYIVMTGDVVFTVAESNINKPSRLMKFPGKVFKPDLVIKSLYADKMCRIHMVVKNQGPGKITDEDHMNSYFVLTSWDPDNDYNMIAENSLTVSGGLPLIQIDPKGQLKQPGGIVDFNTGLVIKKPVRTYGAVDYSDGSLGNQIPESNENNNDLWKELGPMCPSSQYPDVIKPKAK